MTAQEIAAQKAAGEGQTGPSGPSEGDEEEDDNDDNASDQPMGASSQPQASMPLPQQTPTRPSLVIPTIQTPVPAPHASQQATPTSTHIATPSPVPQMQPPTFGPSSPAQGQTQAQAAMMHGHVHPHAARGLAHGHSAHLQPPPTPQQTQQSGHSPQSAAAHAHGHAGHAHAHAHQHPHTHQQSHPHQHAQPQTPISQTSTQYAHMHGGQADQVSMADLGFPSQYGGGTAQMVGPFSNTSGEQVQNLAQAHLGGATTSNGDALSPTNTAQTQDWTNSAAGRPHMHAPSAGTVRSPYDAMQMHHVPHPHAHSRHHKRFLQR